jgi:hypothetical protein
MQMPDYRMYCLNALGHIGSGEWFEAKDDEEALALVRGKKLALRCEVWAGNRLVGTIAPFSQESCHA